MPLLKTQQPNRPMVRDHSVYYINLVNAFFNCHQYSVLGITLMKMMVDSHFIQKYWKLLITVSKSWSSSENGTRLKVMEITNELFAVYTPPGSLDQSESVELAGIDMNLLKQKLFHVKITLTRSNMYVPLYV